MGERGGGVTSPETSEPAGPEPAAAAPPTGREPVPGREPVLPEQSPEDTDAGWGEYPEPADERLYRDRPPHWNDF
jgi:hypothetical protein